MAQFTRDPMDVTEFQGQQQDRSFRIPFNTLLSAIQDQKLFFFFAGPKLTLVFRQPRVHFGRAKYNSKGLLKGTLT